MVPMALAHLLLVAAATGLAGCAGDGSRMVEAEPPADSSTSAAGVSGEQDGLWPLAVFDYGGWDAQPGWDLQEAVYPLEGSWPGLSLESMEWYNEYDRFVDVGGGVQEGFNLVVAGHSEGIGYFDALGLFPGMVPAEPINGRPTFLAVGQDDGSVSILLAVDDGFTIVVHVGGLAEGEVRQIAERVRLVDAEEWEAHGGDFIACPWLSPDCDELPPEYRPPTTIVPTTVDLTTTTGP